MNKTLKYSLIAVGVILLIAGCIALVKKSDKKISPEGDCCTIKGNPAVDMPDETFCKQGNKFYLYSINAHPKDTKTEITEQQYLTGIKLCDSLRKP